MTKTGINRIYASGKKPADDIHLVTLEDGHDTILLAEASHKKEAYKQAARRLRSLARECDSMAERGE